MAKAAFCILTVSGMSSEDTGLSVSMVGAIKMIVNSSNSDVDIPHKEQCECITA